LSPDKKIYFASDFHLGAKSPVSNIEREKELVLWLDQIKTDAEEIYLVGDVFDFWFTYKRSIPKGFARLQGKLAEISDSGISIHLFSGNHDLWGLDYFQDELGLLIHHEPIIKTYQQKKFLIGHGDGLGPGDQNYKILKKYVFLNPLAQWAFSKLHPDLGIGLATAWSGHSRLSQKGTEGYLGKDREWLVQFCYEEIERRKILNETEIDFFIFGHRHLSLDIQLNDKSRYINLGEWIYSKTYGVFDGIEMNLIPKNPEVNLIVKN